MIKADLMLHAMASLAAQSDVFTDAPECAGAVACAQNLQVLARKLQGEKSEIVCDGKLLADGKSLGDVKVGVDGFLVFVPLAAHAKPEDTKWGLRLQGSRAVIKVCAFPGDGFDDGYTFVVDDAEAFYDALLSK